jgi:hypothetical protein
MRWQDIVAEAAAGPLMGMSETLTVLGKLVADGIIDTYAIGGAVAAYNYIEPTVTDDLDVTFNTPSGSGLVALTPIFSALATMGYTEFRGEGIVIGGWRVQFLPVANALDAEALQTAETIDVAVHGQSFQTRILRPEYLVAKALEVDRAKDYARIVQFIEEQAVDRQRLTAVLDRFGLSERWNVFCRRMGIQPDGRQEDIS